MATLVDQLSLAVATENNDSFLGSLYIAVATTEGDGNKLDAIEVSIVTEALNTALEILPCTIPLFLGSAYAEALSLATTVALACTIPICLGPVRASAVPVIVVPDNSFAVLGPAKAIARVVPYQVRGVIAGFLLAKATGETHAIAYARVGNFIRSSSGSAVSRGSLWSSTGIGAPHTQTYTYLADRGLVRTEMDSGIFRQRRKWTNGYRTATITFHLLPDQLARFEGFLSGYGYDWFVIPLITESNAGATLQDHTIRAVSDPSFGSLYGDAVEVSLQVEIQ